MNFPEFITKLETRLKEPLPGHAPFLSQAKLARPSAPPKDESRVRKSAVLINFYPKEDGIFVPFILRPKYDGAHGGQMAFPGGGVEPCDESIIRTAIREAQEEIGIKTLDINVIGKLTDIYIAPSFYWVTPIVSFMPYMPTFFPDEKEVDRIYEINYRDIDNVQKLQTTTIKIGDKRINTKGYIIENQVIWGATAMMIAELNHILQ